MLLDVLNLEVNKMIKYLRNGAKNLCVGLMLFAATASFSSVAHADELPRGDYNITLDNGNEAKYSKYIVGDTLCCSLSIETNLPKPNGEDGHLRKMLIIDTGCDGGINRITTEGENPETPNKLIQRNISDLDSVYSTILHQILETAVNKAKGVYQNNLEQKFLENQEKQERFHNFVNELFLK